MSRNDWPVGVSAASLMYPDRATPEQKHLMNLLRQTLPRPEVKHWNDRQKSLANNPSPKRR
jgi:hypothetical protein